MSEFKCKGCLTDSTHGKLQKKKDALLEFIFSNDSLCLTVSAQNVNITTYTLSKDAITNISSHNDLLVINFKTKNQIKISAMPTNKLIQLKQILECLLNEDIESYDKLRGEFCLNSLKTPSTVVINRKTIKIDRMKIKENDENSQPIIEKKKSVVLSAPNFYQNSQSTDENNYSPKTTNKTSPYFFHRTDNNNLKRTFMNDESRHRTILWDDPKSPSSTGTIRKKGLKNIGATCYMNSILQCLLNLDSFRYDLMLTNVELITSTLLEENTIYLCVLRILALLQDRQSTQSQTNSTTTQLTDDERSVELQALTNLKKAVEKHSGIFLGSRQQDSHEFLNLVISLITDEIESIRKQQVIQSISFRTPLVDPTTNNFQFCLATQRSCQICGMSTITTEIHTSLLIHVTDEQFKMNSLTDLLENYFASESIDGCFCDHCQSNQRKNIKYHLEKLPRILIFYLKRWQITKNAQGELQSVSKEDHPIDCSMEINVYPFCSSTTSQPVMIDYVHDLPNLKELLKQRDFLDIKRSKIEQIDSTINSETCHDNRPATHADYQLFALINHHGGSSDVGHYTSTVYDVKCATWWTYDDTSVTACTEERVLKDLAPDAYGVMYMHKDILKQFQLASQSN